MSIDQFAELALLRQDWYFRHLDKEKYKKKLINNYLKRITFDRNRKNNSLDRSKRDQGKSSEFERRLFHSFHPDEMRIINEQVQNCYKDTKEEEWKKVKNEISNEIDKMNETNKTITCARLGYGKFMYGYSSLYFPTWRKIGYPNAVMKEKYHFKQCLDLLGSKF